MKIEVKKKALKEGFYYTIDCDGVLIVAEIVKYGNKYLLEYNLKRLVVLRSLCFTKSAMIKTIKKSQLKFLGR